MKYLLHHVKYNGVLKTVIEHHINSVATDLAAMNATIYNHFLLMNLLLSDVILFQEFGET